MQWDELPLDDTSWEKNWEQLCEDYHLEDKVNLHGPTDDTKKGASSSRDTQSGVQNQNQEVQIPVKTKRTITRSSYRHDYV